MNELDFRKWLEKKGTQKKVQGDYISRLKRIERGLDHCDLDDQYRNDRCEFLLEIFSNRGENDTIKKYPDLDLPIGKSYMSTYKHSIKKYVAFCDEVNSSKKK